MKRAIRGRALLILALVLLCGFAMLHWPVRLGLDLRGGASVILRVKTDEIPAAERRAAAFAPDAASQLRAPRIRRAGRRESAAAGYPRAEPGRALPPGSFPRAG